MCGRFTIAEPFSRLAKMYTAGSEVDEDWQPSYSVAPTDRVPIVRERERRDIELASWDLRPAWMKTGGPPKINARLESVATNGFFKNAFASARAVVPMTGYYEWTIGPDGKKDPYYLHGTGVLSAAGLYAARKDAHGEWTLTCTVITRAARDSSGELHDRMPVFLTAEDWPEWIAPGKIASPEPMLALLDRSSREVATTISARLVDRKVNSTASVDPRDPTLIDAVDP